MSDDGLKALWERLRALEHQLHLQAERIAQIDPSDGGFQLRGESTQAVVERALMPLARALSDAFDFDPEIRHPKQLASQSAFQQGIRLLADSALSHLELLNYVGGGEHPMFGPMALMALRRRGVHVLDEVCERLYRLDECTLHFALEYLLFARGTEKIAKVFLHSDPNGWWRKSAVICESLRAFVLAAHKQEPEPPLLGQERIEAHLSSDHREQLRRLLQVLDLPVLMPMYRELSSPEEEPGAAQYELLVKIGRMWSEDPMAAPIVEHPHGQRILQQAEALLTGPARRSVVLVGTHGVGKSVLIERLCRRLDARGWRIFLASAADVLAGQRYIGQLEQRVAELLEALNVYNRVIWVIPDFHELLEKGATEHDPTGILDLLLPAMERRKLLVLGETRPDPYARMLRKKHKLHYAVEAFTLAPASLEDTVEIARQWASLLEEREDQKALEDGVIEEAVHLSQQYLSMEELPGSIMQLLQRAATRKQLGLEEVAGFPITVEDLLATIAQLTQLPEKVLDDRQRLALDEVREFFQQSVIGQEEAVECLVERIAMIKAGMADPTRPLGVFLFAGPTGTGKTELAKTLCRFLFGDERRMIRLDMSEYHNRDAYWRLLEVGDSYRQTRSLASQIEEQPFSVVLLDEIEKAHPQIWDLFLQVFDDGRLTDRSGNTVDFRHSVIILTSNLGSNIPTSPGVGFTAGAGQFMPESVRRAIEQTFRREFLNRIDQIVVFNPLSRSVMRDILQKELNSLLLRRGFRSKKWEVEWGVKAVDFLLEQGFTPDLGARPLKRAIERHLLVPLAKTIVEHRVPQGNQLLFVTSDGSQIQAQFVDPERPAKHAEQENVATRRKLTLRMISLDAKGEEAELAFLHERWAALSSLCQEASWVAQKQEIQARMHTPSFVSAPDRYQILEKLEAIDRIEAGIESTRASLSRLQAPNLQPETLQRLAQHLLMISLGLKDVRQGIPQNAMIHIAGVPAKELPREATFDMFGQVKKMYERWAERCRMRSMWLRRGSLEEMEAILIVNGLGVWSTLSQEQGLHIFELPREDGSLHLTRVRVQASLQPMEQPSSNQSMLTSATELFSRIEGGADRICRHYRWAEPTLVHDHVRGWQTDQIMAVLHGYFDLFEAEQGED